MKLKTVRTGTEIETEEMSEDTNGVCVCGNLAHDGTDITHGEKEEYPVNCAGKSDVLWGNLKNSPSQSTQI